MSRYMMEDELTGYEEHLAYEAGAEDLDALAMRLEAQREAAMESAMYEYEAEIEQAEFEARQANPLTAVCAWEDPWKFKCCCSIGDDDNIPF